MNQGGHSKVELCLKTLQSVKEKGEWGPPSFRDDYFAAQMKAMICWCNPSYVAQRKGIEKRVSSIPIQAILANNNLKSHINTTDNPCVKFTLKTWKTVIKEWQSLNGAYMTQTLHPINWILESRTGQLKE